jgi:hypothetical protein
VSCPRRNETREFGDFRGHATAPESYPGFVIPTSAIALRRRRAEAIRSDARHAGETGVETAKIRRSRACGGNETGETMAPVEKTV